MAVFYAPRFAGPHGIVTATMARLRSPATTSAKSIQRRRSSPWSAMIIVAACPTAIGRGSAELDRALPGAGQLWTLRSADAVFPL